MRDFFAVSALLFVASEANFGLRFLVQDRVSRFVNFVAIVTRHTVVLVLGTIPMRAVSTFVAGQALRRTFFVIRNGECTFLEDNIWRCAAFDFRVALDVLVAFAVAGLAVGSA